MHLFTISNFYTYFIPAFSPQFQSLINSSNLIITKILLMCFSSFGSQIALLNPSNWELNA